MGRRLCIGLALGLAVIVSDRPAAAQDSQGSGQNGRGAGIPDLFDEARVGTIFSFDEADESGLIVSGELLFRSFTMPRGNYLADTVLRPRLFVGGNFATGDDGIDQIFAGLSWHFPVFAGTFLEATFGGTLHDGRLDTTGDGPFLGCHVLFRESAAVGVDVGPRWTLLAQVDHASHAGICDGGNSGLTHAGAYVGFKF